MEELCDLEDGKEPESKEKFLSRDVCPKCGSQETYVQRWGMTKLCGDVLCAKCRTYIRDWDAY